MTKAPKKRPVAKKALKRKKNKLIQPISHKDVDFGQTLYHVNARPENVEVEIIKVDQLQRGRVMYRGNWYPLSNCYFNITDAATRGLALRDQKK